MALNDVEKLTEIPADGWALVNVAGELKMVQLGDIGNLPVVTVDDNGKFLGVVNGAWGKTDVPSGLPTVSADDDGKVLMVQDGEWRALSLPVEENPDATE